MPDIVNFKLHTKFYRSGNRIKRRISSDARTNRQTNRELYLPEENVRFI